MKNNILKLLALSFLFVMFSCNDEDYELGRKLDASELDFSVTQDYNIDEGGNTIILKNNTPGTIPIWDYGTGKSNKATDTIRFAFAGEYTIKFSAATAGGVVAAEPVTVTVTDDNFDYVTDELWVKLSGGVGKSKRWILDLDETGLSKYFAGPLFFYGTDNGWIDGGEPAPDGSQPSGCYGEDCWNWNPDWAGNTWLMDAADYGYMEFSLDGGPYVTVDHLTLPSLGKQEGTYYLDVNSHTLTMFDAVMLHNSSYDTCSSNWGQIKIFSLTEDTMQLGVVREAIGSCASEGPAIIVYNFISQEYSDNWVPEEEVAEPDEGFEPTFQAGELLNILTGGPAAGRYWKLDGSGNPVDWLASGAGWTTSSADSYNWGWNDDWTAIASNSYIRFDQYGGTQNFYKYQDGVETSGTFTIDEATNEITLSDSGTLIGVDGHWLTPTTSTLTVIKAIPSDFQNTGLWFGTSYDETKDEWLAFHYVINNNVSGGGGSIGGNSGTSLSFDNSKLVFGDIETNGNLRLELYNEYGATKNDPGLNIADVSFNNKIEVTFTLSGTGVTGDYSTSIYFADTDWNPQGNGEAISVTGDGTYTVTFNTPSFAEGAVVFVVDIVGMSNDIADINTVTATIDSVKMFNN